MDREPGRLQSMGLQRVGHDWTTNVHIVSVPSSYAQTWEMDHKEVWALKKWYFWTVVLEKILESPLDCKDIKPVNPNGNQHWIFIGRIDAEAEAQILRLSDVKSRLTGKDLDAGKDWGQEEKRATEDEMIWWHHQCNGHELGKTPGDGVGQGGLACCTQYMGSQRVRHNLATEQ